MNRKDDNENNVTENTINGLRNRTFNNDYREEETEGKPSKVTQTNDKGTR